MPISLFVHSLSVADVEAPLKSHAIRVSNHICGCSFSAKIRCGDIAVLSAQMHSMMDTHSRESQCLCRGLLVPLRRLLQTTLRVPSNP